MSRIAREVNDLGERVGIEMMMEVEVEGREEEGGMLVYK